MLSIKDLEFSYGTKKVLDGVSLDIDRGQIVSIMGPNGIGKTTLLKCLCNIHRPQAGTVLLEGKDLYSYAPRELAKHVAYVPQRPKATRLNVIDSVLVGRRPHIEWDIGREDVDKAWDAIKKLGLEHLAMKYVDEISGGEFQKVQIARAIVQEAELLVLDEPSSALDIANQHVLMKLLREVVKERNITVLMTMHDINLATYYSDRFLFIADGRNISYGGLETITPEIFKRSYGVDVDIMDYKGIPIVVKKLE